MADDTPIVEPTPPVVEPPVPAPPDPPAQEAPTPEKTSEEPTPQVTTEVSAPVLESQPPAPPAEVTYTEPPDTSDLHNWNADDRGKSIHKRAARREHKLEKLIAFAKAKNRPISNNDIQIAIAVSHHTAVNYAKLLVERGVFMVQGKTKFTRYALKK